MTAPARPGTARGPIRLPTVEELVDASALARVLGDGVDTVEVQGAAGLGYSYTGNRLDRVGVRLTDGSVRRLVLKRNRLADNWLARRTGDAAGREVRVFEEPTVSAVWEVFASPYLAYAASGGEVGLLMDDVSEWLPPDVDEPLRPAEQAALVDALATLHARFWDGPIRSLAWAATPSYRFGVLHPCRLDEEVPLFDWVRRGWPAALARLPGRIGDLLMQPPERLAETCDGLPWTLLHGDAKVANFALLPDGRVAAFDWELVSVGPAPLELGYYLAVNSGRVVGGKGALLARYRAILEAELGRPIGAESWRRFEAVTVLAGAVNLLWQKALPLLEADPPKRARDEFDWWAESLARHW